MDENHVRDMSIALFAAVYARKREAGASPERASIYAMKEANDGADATKRLLEVATHA